MLKTIDLFAGAGGLSLGFMQTGKFEILAAAEINKNARETYKNNIAKDNQNFVFIDNVIGCDFAKLSDLLGGIDIVIGGPPCQGFSNANRQKNHLISMNNGLVKEYFRAIKEIRPKAFVMENVSMLRSETHRFYESTKDNDEITALIKQGFNIPKRRDTIVLAKNVFDGINLENHDFNNANDYAISESLFKLLRVLLKNIGNEKRLSSYLKKNTKKIVNFIEEYKKEKANDTSVATDSIRQRLEEIQYALTNKTIETQIDNLQYIVELHKLLSTIKEIDQNGIIGHYSINKENELIFTTFSYSVIDYVNAILGGEYIQNGEIVNAEWFGVPQERRRYIVFGIRKDLCPSDEISLPTVPNNMSLTTVGDAIFDLMQNEVGYDPKYPDQEYAQKDNVCEYAAMMRQDSVALSNHITTKSTDLAIERFKKIKPGNNFHSLSNEMKSTYAKPERTQNTIYLRLNPNAPSGTVVNVRKSMWIHPVLDRAISVREAARLQSFPDTFIFYGSKDSQYQQIGNAVPPLMAKGIANNVLKNLNI